MTILTINSGSSSLKFSIFRMENNLEKIESRGEISDIGLQEGFFRIEDGEGNEIENKEQKIKGHSEALEMLFNWLKKGASGENITAVGHRIVHGGSNYRKPVLLNKKELKKLEEMISLAPEHLPHEIKAIQIMMEKYPDLKQTACFDTGFHRNMPIVSQRYPLPIKYWDEGIKHYGFHGLSYEYILMELQKEAGSEILQDRIIIAHLGNGASMTAVRNGTGIDTTMGFTPAGGLMMGTRAGDLDPEVVIYLMKEKGMNIPEVNQLLNEKSGLVAVSEESSSMVDLLTRNDDKAKLAVEMFCYQAQKYLGALVSVLGGLDTLVFTAGIGENSPEIRKRICKNFGYMGLLLDEKRNQENAGIISSDESNITVRVMKTNEELMIARHTCSLINYV